ncbi:MAG: ribosomal L7Ae/L30e/S12e/Gadd45 family protein [archaeon]|nr:ribosomal L7Ae/L30e/S12e/Gadd45 family protein [archaeon]
MSENNEAQPQPMAEEPAQEMTRELAIKQVLETAATRGCLVKGITEVCKALEARKVKWVFLAEDCDNNDYKNLIKALSNQMGAKVFDVPEWVALKDGCKIGLSSEKIKQVAESKGKEAKIKPRCSSCAIIEFGEETEGFKFLQKEA